MTPELFTVWLQGFVELNNGAMPSTEQWNSICQHLKTVFNKVTPPVFPLSPNVPLVQNPYQSIPGISPPTIIC